MAKIYRMEYLPLILTESKTRWWIASCTGPPQLIKSNKITEDFLPSPLGHEMNLDIRKTYLLPDLLVGLATGRLYGLNETR